MKKTNVSDNLSGRTVKKSVSGIHRGSTISLHSVSGSLQGSSVMDRNSNRRPRPSVRVLDADGTDVTPLPIYQEGKHVAYSKPDRFFLDGIFSTSGSDAPVSSASFNMPYSSSYLGSSKPTSVSKASLTNNTEDSVLKVDLPTQLPATHVQRQRDVQREMQQVTAEMLDEVVDICLSETDTISLLDIPSNFILEETDGAEAIKSNDDSDELCQNKAQSYECETRGMQTVIGASKHKQVQCNKVTTADAGTIATVWDIYDSYQNPTPGDERADHAGGRVTTGKGPVWRGEKSGSSSSSSTVYTGSTMSSLEMEMHGNSFGVEVDPQHILQSEALQETLLVMERTVIANILQPKLAAYKQLPVFEDDTHMMEPENSSDEEDSSSADVPALEHLWSFSCKLTKGRPVTSITCNKKNPELLAVGYGDCNSTDQKGLICCWSIKNIMWPDRIFHCDSKVTSLDFSTANPSLLAVGMMDGNVAIYSVLGRVNNTSIASSSGCWKKHIHEVRQVTWTTQETSLSREDEGEALVSVSSDGRISKWLLVGNNLNCIDMITLPLRRKRKAAESKREINHALSSARSPGVCSDFHPTDSSIFLVGTWEGDIHKCRFSQSLPLLETYQKHSYPVNHIEWSPFSTDLFLSCSFDWTIQLWKQGHQKPLLGFMSTQRAVNSVTWSPHCPTVFAATRLQQVEIWDLQTSLKEPTIVHPAEPDVQITCLLFDRRKDSVLIGDTTGQVKLYEIKNLQVGEEEQVESLEDIIRSAVHM